MSIRVLLAAYTPGYDVLIQHALESTKRYVTFVASSAAQALVYLQRHHFSIVVLDVASIDPALYELARGIRKSSPDSAVMLMVPGAQASHPLMGLINPDAVLRKPLEIPDLVQKFDRLNQKKNPVTPPVALSVTPPVTPPPEKTTGWRIVRVNQPQANWLQDVNRAAQYLARLSMESSAQAALIVRNRGLWAYAGQLDQAEAQELTKVVTMFWENRTRPLPGQPQPGKTDLARFTRLQSSGNEYMLYATSLNDQMILAMAFDAETPFGMMRTQAGHLARALASPPEEVKKSSSTMQRLAQEEQAVSPAANLKPLLDDIPPPSPRILHPETRPLPATIAGVPDLEELLAAQSTATSAPEHIKSPSIRAGIDPHNVVGIPPAIVNIVYASVLIPRMPAHYLKGDLANRLGEWLPELSLAFGWRLDQIAIQPEYLMWLIKVPPTTSPSYMMRVIRQHTSRRIFEEFPTLARQNPSGDFWAPGYLMMSGSVPPLLQVIQDFIQQTRASQANPGTQAPLI